MVEFILKYLKEFLIFTAGIVLTVLGTRYKEGIKKGTNYVIDSLLSLAKIYFLMKRRYIKSIIRSYRETKVGYRNLRLDLDKNYISLKVHCFVHFKDKDPEEIACTKKMDVTEALKENRHLVILGHPGAGKTTLMQWLLLKYAYGHMKAKLKENLIPIFITLRSLESGQSVDQLVSKFLKQHRFKGGESFIRKRMESGKCILIFDGMDEILDEPTRKKFISDITDTYSTQYGQSRIIITSRIEDYSKDPFPSTFKEREILDLEMDQVCDFVNGILKEEDDPKGLIQQIEKSEGLKKFVTNPLMLSLLTFVYQESHHKLPNDRVKVYNKCMQLMLQDRDESRGIYEYRNKFDIDDKELLLRKSAYYFAQKNMWRFTEKELLDYWQEICPVNLKESDLKKLLQETCKANGILKHISAKELSFLHRTFQEYYAALEISGVFQQWLVHWEELKKQVSLPKEEIEKSLNSPIVRKEWQEIVLFLVGMMEDAGPLIENFFLKTPRFALKCLTYAKRANESITDKTIHSLFDFGLEEGQIEEIISDFIYLALRKGLPRVIELLSIGIKIEKRKDLLWSLIDQILHHFSPQKKMVYVGSIKNKGNPADEWQPGFWMDKYPVTNRDFQRWTKAAKIKNFPLQWVAKADYESMVTIGMESLPIVDVDYKMASDFTTYLKKELPEMGDLQRIFTHSTDVENTGLLNGIRKKFLKKNKLEQLFTLYLNSRPLALDLDRVLARALDRALALNLARTLDLDLARVLDLDLDLDRDLDSARARARVLALDLDLTLDRALDLIRDLDRNLYTDSPFDQDFWPILSFAKDYEWTELERKVSIAQNLASEINKKKGDSLTEKVYHKNLALGRSIAEVLIALIEIVQFSVPKDLLAALRQPGLLIPVDSHPPNSLGIYDMVGHVWQWTSTTDGKGRHRIFGGAWTDETFYSDKKEWRYPSYRDINLGFRCVCDWDKICDVKCIDDEDLNKSGTEEMVKEE